MQVSVYKRGDRGDFNRADAIEATHRAGHLLKDVGNSKLTRANDTGQDRAYYGRKAFELSPQITMATAVSEFGAAAKAKLAAKAITGEPEDQLRGPLETFIQHMSNLAGHKAGTVVAVGETTLAGQGTRPDYAISVGDALTGFIEVKAPGKGADPR